MNKQFIDFIKSNYSEVSGIPLGRPVYENEINNDYEINIPLKTFTRHGLVAGSTGTGKSRAIQLMIEKLSDKKISVFLSDIKGDMSGFCTAGNTEKVLGRAQKMNYTFSSKKYPTNYWGSHAGLIKFKISLDDVDFIILAKLLELNPTQESHLGSIYKFAKDKKIKIQNLKDLSDIVSYLIKYPEKHIGSSKSSLSVIHRKIGNLEYNNFNNFFDLPSFEINDFLSEKINIFWLQNYQKKKYNTGNLVSFFLYRLYSELPEIGDVTEPKLVVFIDEAHQIFNNANKNLVDLMVSILKQIRSKGVGIVFNTQSAEDIPEKILEQLGFKIQFALRAFSQEELDDIKGAMNSFPASELYNLKEEVKSLNNGTAFVSVLNESGSLLPPVKTMIYPPASLMDAPDIETLKKSNSRDLLDKYNREIQSEPLNLGSPLDNISVSRGGKWQINRYIERKEDQKVKRAVNKRNKTIKKFMYLLIAILGLSAFIFFLFLIYKILEKLS